MIKADLPEEVLNWLYFAEDDFQGARIMLKEKLFNKVCFLSQQTVEKSLKAYLLMQKKGYTKTHKIIDLVAECGNIDAEFNGFENQAAVIDQYYLPTRYPDMIIGSLPNGLPKAKQAEESLELALKMLEFVKKKLGI